MAPYKTAPYKTAPYKTAPYNPPKGDGLRNEKEIINKKTK